MTKLHAKLLKQVEILRAFVNSLANFKATHYSEGQVHELVYAAKEVMEAVKKLDKGQIEE